MSSREKVDELFTLELSPHEGSIDTENFPGKTEVFENPREAADELIAVQKSPVTLTCVQHMSEYNMSRPLMSHKIELFI